MVTFLLNVLFVTVGSVLGVGFGWWLRSIQPEKKSPAKAPVKAKAPKPEKQDNPPKEPAKSPSEEKLSELMGRLHQLTATVAVDVGEHNSRVKEINDQLSANPTDPDSVVAIVEQLLDVNQEMNEQLASAENRLQLQASEIESHVQDARTDALTTLLNRRGFDDELKNAIDEAKRTSRPVCVAMLDVDFFKKFNDTYGHQAGDEVLKSVGRVVRRKLTGREIVCRYGGEEFAVIFPGSDLESSKLGAERARQVIADTIIPFEGQELKVTSSVGLAELLPSEEGGPLIKRADQALYASKEAGRNNTHWHDGKKCLPIVNKDARPTAAVEKEKEQKANESNTTDLSTRDAICQDLDRRLGEYRRGGATVSMVLLEIDKFDKLVLEDGQQAGHVVRRAASQFLKATIRDMDHIADYERATFALLLPTATAADASRVAERLRRAVERCSLQVGGKPVQFTVSLGVAEVTAGDTREDLLTRAEFALHEARRGDGNRICTSEPAVSPT